MKKSLLLISFLTIMSVCSGSLYGHMRIPSGWYFVPGGNFGYGIQDSSRKGFLVGPEISIVYLDTGTYEGNRFHSWRWYGIFADALRDSTSESFRYSIGPEIGFGYFGLEAGLLSEYRDNTRFYGSRLGFLLSAGFFSLYGRWGRFYTAGSRPDYLELGILVKYPLYLD